MAVAGTANFSSSTKNTFIHAARGMHDSEGIPMRTLRGTLVISIGLLLLGLSGCTEQERVALQTEVARSAETAVAEGVAAAKTQAVQVKNTAAARIATEIADRGGRAGARRVLVLLQGLNSSNHGADRAKGTESCTWFDVLLVLGLKEQGGLYDDVIHYSYAGYREPYSPIDTYQPVDVSVRVLDDTLHAYLREPGHEASVFDLVGHSLGGVVAWRLALLWGLDPEKAPHIRHVATLHSPVNGSSVLRSHLRDDPAAEQNRATVEGIWGGGARSEAAQDLAEMVHIKAANQGLAEGLRRNGVLVRTFASDSDLVIPAADAIIGGGFGWHQDLGSGGALRRCRWTTTPALDLSSAVGHRQILHTDEGLLALRAFVE